MLLDKYIPELDFQGLLPCVYLLDVKFRCKQITKKKNRENLNSKDYYYRFTIGLKD